MAVQPKQRDERNADRRAYRRMGIHLPVECRRQHGDRCLVLRTITENVSTGGMYFEMGSADLRPGDRIDVELTVPPADGVSPYQGRASCQAEVVRVASSPIPAGHAAQRYGIASRFLDRLRFSF